MVCVVSDKKPKNPKKSHGEKPGFFHFSTKKIVTNPKITKDTKPLKKIETLFLVEL